jgi:hypothetical protein
LSIGGVLWLAGLPARLFYAQPLVRGGLSLFKKIDHINIVVSDLELELAEYP